MNMETPTTLKLKIERLNYELPEFPVRVSWTSSDNQIKWQNRISRLSKIWEIVERYRENSLQNCKEEDLPYLVEECKKIGRIVVPLQKVGISEGYGGTKKFVVGQPFTWRVAVTIPENVNKWVEFYDRLRYNTAYNDGIGYLLGYPDCCVKFFKEFWIKERFLDTTWPMAVNSPCGYLPIPDVKSVNITLKNPLQNILLRWLGVRAVSHLPCSFDCAPTLEIAQKNLVKLKDLFDEESEWLRELLSFPLTWSALHGICEVKTPLFRFIARTDATGEEYKVSVKQIETVEQDIWTDNGFSSKKAMDEAHAPIVSAVKSWVFPGKILDLGCGNGELLKKLIAIDVGYIPCGVDFSPNKIRKCKEKMPKGEFTQGSMFIQPLLWEKEYSCVIFTPRRLLETSDELANHLLNKIHKCTKLLITYLYNDYGNEDKLKHQHIHLFEGKGWKLKFDYGNVKVFYHD